MNESKLANPTALGYFGIFIAAWMINMVFCGWFGESIPHVGYLITLILGGVLPSVVGILTYFKGKSLDTIILLAFGTFSIMLGLYGLTIEDTLMEITSGYDGWANIALAAFFFCLWMVSFGRDTGRNLFLLGLWLTFIAHAIGHWTSAMVLFLIAGYIGLITALLAGYISCREISDALQKKAG